MVKGTYCHRRLQLLVIRHWDDLDTIRSTVDLVEVDSGQQSTAHIDHCPRCSTSSPDKPLQRIQATARSCARYRLSWRHVSFSLIFDWLEIITLGQTLVGQRVITIRAVFWCKITPKANTTSFARTHNTKQNTACCATVRLRRAVTAYSLDQSYRYMVTANAMTVKPGFHYPSWRPELTGDRFPLPVNTGRVDGRAFPLAELTGRQHGPSTRVVETGLNTA